MHAGSPTPLPGEPGAITTLGSAIASASTVAGLGHGAQLDLLAVDPSRYEVRAEIATGGMGRILAAYDRRLDRPVAIKQLLVNTAALRRRFEREVRISARLQHPSIVSVLEAGIWPSGELFYAMKHVAGRALSTVIAERPTLGERLSLVPHVIAAVDALAYAHDQRVIHRDLKPANVLVGDFGDTVVIDWGLAKIVGTDEPDEPVGPYRTASTADHTVAGTILGTPAYMPPEQARGEIVDQRADVYALGALLYHVLAGSPPFTGPSAQAILETVLARPPEPLEQVQPAVSPDLVAIVKKAMAIVPAERYATAAELASDLKRFQTGQLVRAHAYSGRELVSRWIRRHRAAVTTFAASLIVLIVGGVVSVRNIVIAEQQAREQRDEAQRGRSEAREARGIAEERSRALMLQQARTLLATDPTMALAWVRTFIANGGAPHVARVVAADAWTRGVSRHVLTGHAANVTQVAFLGDGTGLVSGSFDRTVRLWDTEHATSRELGKHAYPGVVWQLAVSRDGRTIVSRDTEGVVHSWSPTTTETHAWPGRPGHDAQIALSDDGRWLAQQGRDGILRIVGVHDDEQRVLGPAGRELIVAAFSPDGRQLATGSDDGVRLWDVSSGRMTRLDGVRRIVAIAFSHDGRRLAAMDDRTVVRIWTARGALEHVLRGHVQRSDWYAHVVFTHDDRFLVTNTVDELYAWDVESGTGWLKSKGAPQIIAMVAFPSGHSVAFADTKGGVHVWDVDHPLVRSLLGHAYFVYGLAVSADGKLLASASIDATVRLWNVEDGSASLAFPGPGEDVDLSLYPPHAFSGRRDRLVTTRDRAIEVWHTEHAERHVLGVAPHRIEVLALSPDATELVSAGGEHAIRIWSVDSGKVRLLEGHGADVSAVAWAPRGDHVASADTTGALLLWDPRSGTSRPLRGHRHKVTALAFSHDGTRLASVDELGITYVWDVGAGRPVLTSVQGATNDSSVSLIAFSPDDRWLATVGASRSIRLWALDAKNGEGLRLLRGNTQTWALDFSPDSRTLATGNTDHTIRIWNLRDDAVRVLAGSGNAVNSVEFSPDGGRLVSSCAEDASRLWDVASGENRRLPHDGYVAYSTFSTDGSKVLTWWPYNLQTWADELPFDAPGLLGWIDAHTSVTAGPLGTSGSTSTTP